MVKIGLNWEGPDDLSVALLLLRASLSSTFFLPLSLILDKTWMVPGSPLPPVENFLFLAANQLI